jgi:threonine dehydratase
MSTVTPVMTSRYLNELTGAKLFFKCENLQKAGAFKVRGASNAVFGLIEAQAAKRGGDAFQRQPCAVCPMPRGGGGFPAPW